MRDAVIVDAVRTPVGRRGERSRAPTPSTSARSSCAPWPTGSGSIPGLVDDVIWGCVSQVGSRG